MKSARLRSGNTKSCGCLKAKTGDRVYAYNQAHSFKDGVFIPALTQKVEKRNKTGVKGVRAIKRKCGMRYVARITLKYKMIQLGTFDTFEEAVAARQEAEAQYFHPYLNKA